MLPIFAVMTITETSDEQAGRERNDRIAMAGKENPVRKGTNGRGHSILGVKRAGRPSGAPNH